MSVYSLELLAKVRAKARAESAKEAKCVLEGKNPQGVYGSPLHEYLQTFADVLPKEGLEGYLSQLVKAKKRKLRALDVAGQGVTLMELKERYLESITAITLNDFRSESRRVSDRRGGLTMVAGDISVGSTWSKIYKEKFDLITCRPLGGIDALIAPEIIIPVFNIMYRKLDVGGLLLTEVPYCIVHEHGVAWAEELGQIPGVIREFYREKYTRKTTLSVIKGNGAPEDLRFLK